MARALAMRRSRLFCVGEQVSGALRAVKGEDPTDDVASETESDVAVVGSAVITT
jgi:hypothetical protein